MDLVACLREGKIEPLHPDMFQNSLINFCVAYSIQVSFRSFNVLTTDSVTFSEFIFLPENIIFNSLASAFRSFYE